MCGLAFYQDANISDHEVDVFNQLMVVTSLRGKDSTGVCAVFKPSYAAPEGTKPLVRLQKRKGPVYSLLETTDYTRAVGSIPANRQRTILFGHCRQATKGHRTAANAHPFFTGNIIGVHNGTISAGLEIPEGETDSQALFELIDKEGIEALKDITGAYALMWYDLRNDTFNVLRNEQRPLFFGFRSASIVGASEKAALEFISSRSTVRVTDIQEFKPYHHYSMSIDKTYRPFDKRFDIVDKTNVLKKTVGGAVYHGNFRGGTFRGEYGGYYEDYWRDVPPFKKGEEKTSSPTYVTLRGSKVSLNKNLYSSFLKKGCAVCGTECDETDWTFWRNPDTYGREYICAECAMVQAMDQDDAILKMFPGLLEEFKKSGPSLYTSQIC